MDTDSEDAAVSVRLMFAVRGCAYAALMLNLWEWTTTLSFETLVIWQKATDYRIRLLYCTSRYVGLVAQAVNSLVVGFLQFSYFVSPHHCWIWYSFQLVVAATLHLAMNLNFVFRLHALYKGRVTWPLIAIVVFEIIVFTCCGSSAIRHLTYDRGCLPMDAPSSVLYLSGAQLTTQVIIWSLTLYKSVTIFSNSGWKKIPLLSLVTRDAFLAFTVLTILLAAIISDASRRQIGDKSALLCYFVFPIYVTVVSLSSCRITMNIKTFQFELPTRQLLDAEQLELTTLFSTTYDKHSLITSP